MVTRTERKTRAEQKMETRQRLMDRAVRLFSRRGFARTTTAQIARAAGVSHGAVFMHFGSRDALVRAVAGEIGRAITDRLHELAADRASLRQVLRAHLRCIEEREDLYRNILTELPLLPNDARTAWVGIQSAISTHMAKVVRAEMRAGTLRKMPQALLFNTWIGLVHHYLANRELFAPGASVIARHGRTLTNHFLRLVRSQEEKNR